MGVLVLPASAMAIVSGDFVKVSSGSVIEMVSGGEVVCDGGGVVVVYVKVTEA